MKDLPAVRTDLSKAVLDGVSGNASLYPYNDSVLLISRTSILDESVCCLADALEAVLLLVGEGIKPMDLTNCMRSLFTF